MALIELFGSALELLRLCLLVSGSLSPSSPVSSILITFFSLSSLLVEVQDRLILRTGLVLLLPADKYITSEVICDQSNYFAFIFLSVLN